MLEMVFLDYTGQSLTRICEADEIFHKHIRPPAVN